ncbi:ribosomal protein L32 [Diaporthe helianthi]|uniref:Ribosomal protein L32 n=1 Tax=Diaporthe helianthi TaxID=158607 RepID=A0A2P5HLY9_DIAHE|nr:ribosomal protein L32 [Diaporthe helianthi]
MASSFNILALPGELRNMIYRLALTTDPPKLEREHKYNCIACTWNPRRTQNRMLDKDGQRFEGCRCWARSGLSLLLVNRQVHDEGASIFWAENHFTFESPAAFTLLVGEKLQLWHRRALRSITVLDTLRERDSAPCDGLWPVLYQCRDLRTLELPWTLELLRRPPTPVNPDPEVAAWAELKRFLPDLETFSRTMWTCWAGGNPMRTIRSLDMRVLEPEQLKVAGHITLDEYGRLFQMCVLTLLKDRVAWRKRQDINNTGRPHECIVSQREQTWTEKYTMQELFQPLSPGAIIRNKVRKRRDEWMNLFRRRLLEKGGIGSEG